MTSRHVFYGWWIVLGFVVLNIYWAGTLIYGLTVFFTPVRHAFGWSAALLAFIFSLTNVLTGVVAPLVGAWFDRSGPRRMLILASFCGGLGLLALSRTSSLGGFLAAWALVSIGYGIWASGTGPAAAALWFERRRGLAIGLILGGGSIGAFLVPVWKPVVDAAGWRTAFAIAGVVMLIVSLPACALLRHRPEDLGLLPLGREESAAGARRERPARAGRWRTASSGAVRTGGGALSAALRSRRFWWITIAACGVQAGNQAALLLMLPRLKDAGLADSLAVTAVTAVNVLGAGGRLGCGWLADSFDPLLLAIVSFTLQAAGLLAFALAPQSLPVLLLFVLAFGLGAGNIRILAVMLFARDFDPAALGRIQGVFFLLLQPGLVLGPVIAGALYDNGHGYAPAFTGFALIAVVMCLPLAALLPRRAGWAAEASPTR
ncbi:MAG TPA: MFS transporter [Dehalococcoidia bacterium]|nr:MFS transporter [Dehalococcoidia bacterium]